MTRETTYKGVMGDLERLIAALFANAGELLESLRETAREQAELIAAKQGASRRLLMQIGHGARMATAVRKMLKAHYGLDAEKLAEFGIQPFRGRTRRSGPAAGDRSDAAGRDRPALRIHRH